MKDKKSIYIWAIISKIINISATILSTVFINRALGVAGKGEYAYIINISSILYVIASLGIGTVYSTYKKRASERSLKSLFTLSLIQTIVLILISMVFLLLNQIMIFWILIITAGSSLRSNLLTLSAIEDVKKRDKQTIIYHTIYLFLTAILFISCKNNIQIALLFYFADTIITSIGLIISYRLKITNIFSKIEKRAIKEFLHLSIQTTLMQLMIVLNYNIDILMLKGIKGAYSVGLYSVAVNLGSLLWLIPDAFKDVILNSASKQDNSKEIVTLMKFNVLISILLTTFFAIFGNIFINIFYGQEYAESYYPTLILFIGNIAMVIYKMIHPLYISNGKQKVVLKTLTFSVLINIIVNALLIPLIGIYGAAIASVMSYTACSVIFLCIFSKDYKIKINEYVINKNDCHKAAQLIRRRK